MAKTSLGIGTKISALALSTLLLSGCYKIEFKETLNLDGTSNIGVKLDMSEMNKQMQNLGENLAGSLTEGLTGMATGESEEPRLAYESCNDPDLLKKYGAESLEGPEKIVTVLDLEKRTSCAPSETEGSVDITVEDIDTATNEVVFTQTIERKADSCDAPAIKAFYQVTDFSEPRVEEYKLQKTVDISCSDSKKDEISVNTITVYENQTGTSQTLTEIFDKTQNATLIPDNTLAELEALTKTPEEIEAEQALAAESNEFEAICPEEEEIPENNFPFFFNNCENVSSSVGVFNYAKYDTSGFKINANGTVSLNLESVVKPAKEEGLKSDGAQGDGPMEANMFQTGIAIDYVLVSPWPIIEHKVGELEDANTLRIDLMTLADDADLTITLETNGSTLKLVSVRTQQQINQLIAGLKEKLMASEAPVERQVEYIYHLSGKIQRLAAIKPSQQVPLGYLNAKLIELGNELQIDPLAELEADFLKDIEMLGEEALSEEIEVEAETEDENTAEDEEDASVNDEDEDKEEEVLGVDNDEEEEMFEDDEELTDQGIVLE